MVTLPFLIGATAIAGSALAFAWGAVSDLRAYEIPNSVSAVIFLTFFPFLIATHSAPVWPSLATAAAVLALGMVLFARGWMGGGDVKLFAAAAVWCGPALLPAFGIVTGLAGAVLAGLLLSPLRRLLPPPPAAAMALAGGQTALAQPMPFGVAIAVGGAWVLAQHAASLR
jgi:prepilin peptidase CpaA